MIAVIFDGDDTLWSTEELYDNARLSARMIVEDAGYNGKEWETLERHIDVNNVAKFGFSPVRFPTSCAEAYEELCRINGYKFDPVIAKQVYIKAEEVFTCNPVLMPDVREVLSYFRDNDVHLVLLTKGDHAVQTSRIKNSGLGGLFHEIRIVAEKTPDIIRKLVEDLGLDTASSWMIGNSMRSDILPALEAGLKAAWIKTHVWEYEQTRDHLINNHVVVFTALCELPAIIIPYITVK